MGQHLMINSRKWLGYAQAQNSSPQLTFQEDSAPSRALLVPREANPKEQFGSLQPPSVHQTQHISLRDKFIISQTQHISAIFLGTSGGPNSGNTFYLDILKDASLNGVKRLYWSMSNSIWVSTQSPVNGWNIFLYSGPKN